MCVLLAIISSTALTLCGRSLDFLTDDTIVFRSGNTLVFYSVSQRAQRLLTLPGGITLDCFTLAPQVGQIAIATHGLPIQGANRQPQTLENKITIYSFPSLDVIKSFNYDGVFPVTHLALSRTGSRLVSVSSLLNRHLCFWDIATIPGPEGVEKLAEYWWNQNGGLGGPNADGESTSGPALLNVLQPPTSSTSTTAASSPSSASASVDQDWSGNSPLLFVSFHPRNHHEFTTGTNRALTWWKLVPKLDGRLLVPLESTVYSSLTRKLLSEHQISPSQPSSLEQFHQTWKQDERNANGLTGSSSMDSESTLTYLRSLSQTLTASGANGISPAMGVSALQSLSDASIQVPETPAELTVSYSSRALRTAWKTGSFYNPPGTSQPSTHRSGVPSMSIPNSTATTERSNPPSGSETDRSGDASTGGGSLDDGQRSFSSGHLLPLPPNVTNSSMMVSASAPVLNAEESKDNQTTLTPSGGTSVASSHQNSMANLKSLVSVVPAAKAPSTPLSSIPQHAPNRPSMNMPPYPPSQPSLTHTNSRKRSVFWGSGFGNTGFNNAANSGAGQQFASRREFQTAWDEEQRRVLLQDALENGSKRRITSWCWTAEGQFLTATNLGEILIWTRGWTKNPTGTTNNATSSDENSAIAPTPTPALHLQINASESATPVSFLSLVATRRFLLAGTSDGRLLWLDPREGLSIHTSKFMSDQPILSLSFAPSFRHFVVLDQAGGVQLGSTVTGPTGAPSQAVPSVVSNMTQTPGGATITLGTEPASTTGRPRSGGSASSHAHGYSASAAMFAHPITKPHQQHEETKEDTVPSQISPTAASNLHQLRIHSFALTRFPLAVRANEEQPHDKRSSFSAAVAATSLTPLSPVSHLIELLPRTNRVAIANTFTREIHLINYRTKDYLASFRFPKYHEATDESVRITCMSSSSDGLLLCVGFANGYLALLDTCPPLAAMNSSTLNATNIGSEIFDLRCIFFTQLHLGPVGHIRFNPGGSHLFSLGAQDNFLYLFRCKDWTLTGYVNMPSNDISACDWLTISGENKIFLSAKDGRLWIITAPDPLYQPGTTSSSYLLPDSVTQILSTTIGIAATAFIGDPLNERGFFTLNVDRKMRRFQLEKREAFESNGSSTTNETVVSVSDKTPAASSSSLKPLISSDASEEWTGHLKVGSVLATSPDGEMIVSGGRDGIIFLRRTHDLKGSEPIILQAHGSIKEFELRTSEFGNATDSDQTPSTSLLLARNGVTSIRFSSDSKLLFSSGVDGGVFIWDLVALGVNQPPTVGTGKSQKIGSGTGSPFLNSAGGNPQVSSLLLQRASVQQHVMSLAVLKDMPTIDLAYHEWPQTKGVYVVHTSNPQIDMTHLGSKRFALVPYDSGSSFTPKHTPETLPPKTYLDHQLTELLTRNTFFHSEQQKLHQAIQSIKSRMEELVYANSHADPLERISDASEFIIDVDLLAKLKRFMTSKIETTKRLIHEENIAKELVLERVRKQCWDSMEVKGCILKSMTPSGGEANVSAGAGASTTMTTTSSSSSSSSSGNVGPIEVSNFSIRALSAREKGVLRKVEFLRRLGVEEEKWIAANPKMQPFDHDEEGASPIPQPSTRTNQQKAGLGFNVGRFGEFQATRDANYILDNHNGVTRTGNEDEMDGGSGSSFMLPSPTLSSNSPQKQSEEKSESKLPTSPINLRAQINQAAQLASQSKATEAAKDKALGLDRDREADWNSDEIFEKRVLFHPLMLFTAIRKRTQIYLLTIKVDRLRRKFNSAFTTLLENKKEVVELIAHKGIRIAEIQTELGLDQPIYLPTLTADEVPSSILTVTDSEVRVAKRLSPLEAAAYARELEARTKDANDEGHIRALQDMMHGSLDNKKHDLNSLARELIKPQWMLSISPENMTDEQKAALLEFERSEKAIRLERETRQRLLETELKKLKTENQDLIRMFDHRLRHLFQQRLNVLKRIQKEEATMLSLVNDVVEHFEIHTVQLETAFGRFAKEIKEVRQNLTACLSQVKRTMIVQQKKHEQLVLEDRGLEKNFKKDFSQLLQDFQITNPSTGQITSGLEWVEYLFRLFKTRPVWNESTSHKKDKAANSVAAAAAAQSGLNIPGLNLTGLGGTSGVPTSAATDRLGLAGSLNPLLTQAGIRKHGRSIGGSMGGSLSARPVPVGTASRFSSHVDVRKASRIMRDLSGVVDTSDIVSAAYDAAGGLSGSLLAPQPRPVSQMSIQPMTNNEEEVSAFEALLPTPTTASGFVLRPPSPHDKKRGPNEPKAAPTTSTNLAYILSKLHAQQTTLAGAKSVAGQIGGTGDDPFFSSSSTTTDNKLSGPKQVDLDPEFGEFDYLPLDPADCPFELQVDANSNEEENIGSQEQGADETASNQGSVHPYETDEQGSEQEFDQEGNPIQKQRPQPQPSQSPTRHTRSSSVSSTGSVPAAKGFHTYNNVWGRLNERRHAKFTKEIELRLSTTCLADLQRTIGYLEQQVEALNLITRDLTVRKMAYDDYRSSVTMNTELILRLNQGLVEMTHDHTSPIVTDLIDCIMIDRSWVDVLNQRILAIANDNVNVLKEMQKFRRGIRAKQWERQRLALLHADAEDLTKELQLLRVTKNLQSLIKAGGHDNKSALEMNIMERKAEHLRQLTKEDIEARSKKLKQLKMKIRNSNAENERLGNSLIALNMLVEERKQIAKFNHDGEEVRLAQARRMVAIADRRHLLQLLEDQKSMMATLHGERDKLRAKTYPSFAALKAKPPQLSLLPDQKEMNLSLAPKPPSMALIPANGVSKASTLTSPRIKKANRLPQQQPQQP